MDRCDQIMDKLDRLNKKNDNIYGHSYIIIDNIFISNCITICWLLSIISLGLLLFI